MLRQLIDHWKVAKDTIHVLFLAAMFSSGIVGCVFYFRIEAKLQSVGESTPGLIWPKDVFKTFRKYRVLAGQNAWPLWWPRVYWVALLFALVSGMALVYLH
jgi:hypothetical protein